jgi:membrane-bound lytic murein transglycosylase B
MHLKYGFSQTYIAKVLNSAKFRQDVLNRYNGKLKNATDFSWQRYKSKILIPQSFKLGRKFMKKYNKYLQKAQKIYGIEKEAVTAFIRVESKFGLFGQEYRSLDVLATLAFFKNRKQRFFKSELEKLFLVSKKTHKNIFEIYGSFAGAMGCVQQMPSIYLKYGVDFNNDNIADPNDMADCIGSIAKFLKINGWKNYKDTIIKPIVKGNNFKYLKSKVLSKYSVNTLANYGIFAPYKSGSFYFIKLYDSKKFDIYLGDSNYRVITKYNHSKQYGVAIGLYRNGLKNKNF